MSDDGGSDLDIFDQLKKPSEPRVGSKKQTLLGVQAPNLPPLPGGAVPPPPLRSRPSTLPGSSSASKPPPPPPTKSRLPAPLPAQVAAPPRFGNTPAAAPPQFAPPPPPPLMDDEQTPAKNLSSASGLDVPPPPPPFPAAPSAIANPPPPAPLPAPGADADDEWGEDDEEEQTQIFAGKDQHSVFHASSTGALRGAGAPPPPMSRPPAALQIPPAPQFPVAPFPVPARQPAALPEPPTSSGGKGTFIALCIAALVLLGGVLAYVLMPGAGTVVVTVAGPGNQPIDAVEVFIDDKKVCTGSPCQVRDLPEGTHMVRAQAAGYQPTAATALKVVRGQESVSNISLVKAPTTGLSVSSPGKGLRLSIDGEDVGPLPQEVKDLKPGKHVLHIGGSKRFEEWEKTLEIREGQVLHLGSVKLKVLMGLATIKAGDNAEDAQVIIQSGADRRTLPSLPRSLEIDPSKPHTITATKKGFETFSHELQFEDGIAEQEILVSLVEIGAEPSEPVKPAPVQRSPRPSTTETSAPEPAPEPAPTPVAETPAPAPSGKGTLNLNSVPRSNVILDGRPLGATPKMGVSVSPGNHTVVFIKDGERRSSSVTVPAGGSKTVTVRF